MSEAFAELIESIDAADAAAVRRIVAADLSLLEQTDSYGFTPLMHAAGCMGREVAVIRELLDAGAAVNRQTDEGYTALHCAVDVSGDAYHNSREVIALLVAAGADLTLRQHYGWTPLLRAIVEGTLDEVDALLAAGADPNVVLPRDTLPACTSGLTALMAAVTNPYGEAVIASLLRAGADPQAPNSGGETFPDYIAALLAEYPSGDFSEKVRRCRDVARRHAEGHAEPGATAKPLTLLEAGAVSDPDFTPESPFDEVWAESPDGQILCALINGDWGWLLYLREAGDSGFSSRNPDYNGSPDAEIEYRIDNGQHDFYSAAWALPVAEVRRALAYFGREHQRPPFVAWHED